MQTFKNYIGLLVLLFVVSSCALKDHEPEKACRYAGQNYISKYASSTYSSITKQNSDYEFNDNGLPLKLISTYSSQSRDSIARAAVSGSTETKQYVFQYNENGFLSRLIYTYTLILLPFPGHSYFDFDYGNFANARIETVETTDFIYKSDKIQATATKIFKTIQGDNRSPVTVNTERSKNYQYDVNMLVLSAEETASDGTKKIMQFTNDIMSSSSSLTKSGVPYSITTYNTKDRTISIKSSGTESIISYTNDNLTKILNLSNNKLLYQQDFFYDTFKNPETAIPSMFKGIPDPILTIQTDGINNQTGVKFTDLLGNSGHESQTSYKYNSNGFPETSIYTLNQSGNVTEGYTTYRYKDCQ